MMLPGAWRASVKRLCPVVFLAVAATIGFSGLAWAASDGDGALMDLLARGINFALLVIILAVVLKKSHVLGIFSTRTEDIKNRMEQLRREKEEAEARALSIRKRLDEFESEKNSILDEARRQGEAEKSVILAEAEKKVGQMLAHVETSLKEEIEDAKNRLRFEVADLAAEKAREIIAREINEDDQERMIKNFIENVRKVH